MKRSDSAVLAVVGLAVLVIAFWVVILGPKRSQESDLSKQSEQLSASVAQLEQTASAAADEQKHFPQSYHKLVVLGKAVPADSDQSSLLVQLNSLAGKAGIDFQSLDLTNNTSGATAAAASQVQTPALLQSGTATTSTTSTTGTSTTPTSTTPDSTATSGTSTTGTTSTTASTSTASTSSSSSNGDIPSETTAATSTATEATAATTPLGSTVGPAGLPVMPYDVTFAGSFFDIADFFNSLDGMVHTGRNGVSVNGRLLTVDGFNLATSDSTTGSSTGKPSQLQASLAVTTYLTPADQGVTGGATPAGPATATTGTTVPTSATTTTPTPTP